VKFARQGGGAEGEKRKKKMREDEIDIFVRKKGKSAKCLPMGWKPVGPPRTRPPTLKKKSFFHLVTSGEKRRGTTHDSVKEEAIQTFLPPMRRKKKKGKRLPAESAHRKTGKEKLPNLGGE